MLFTAESAWAALSMVLKAMPMSPRSSACFETHCTCSRPYGGNRAIAATCGCALPFRRIARLSVIPIRKSRSAVKSIGVCSMSMRTKSASTRAMVRALSMERSPVLTPITTSP